MYLDTIRCRLVARKPNARVVVSPVGSYHHDSVPFLREYACKVSHMLANGGGVRRKGMSEQDDRHLTHVCQLSAFIGPIASDCVNSVENGNWKAKSLQRAAIQHSIKLDDAAGPAVGSKNFQEIWIIVDDTNLAPEGQCSDATLEFDDLLLRERIVQIEEGAIIGNVNDRIAGDNFYVREAAKLAGRTCGDVRVYLEPYNSSAVVPV